MAIIHFLPKFTKAVPATLVAIIAVTGLSIVLKQMGYTLYTVLDFVQGMNPAQQYRCILTHISTTDF